MQLRYVNFLQSFKNKIIRNFYTDKKKKSNTKVKIAHKMKNE